MRTAPMRCLQPTLLLATLALAACGQSNPPPAAPAAVTAPAAVSTPKPATAPPATSTAPVSSAPAPASAAAAATSAAPSAASTEGPEVAGGVTLAQGSVTDTAVDGSKRQLKD